MEYLATYAVGKTYLSFVGAKLGELNPKEDASRKVTLP